MNTQSIDPQSSTAINALDGFDAPVYEQIAEYMLNNLKLIKETISDQLQSMGSAEKQRAQEVEKQVDEYIKQLEHAKKMKALSTFLKILGPIFLVIAVLIVAFFPTPMSIALLMVTLAMFLEPYIAKAAGYQSIVEQGMNAFMKAFTDKMGEKTGAIVGMIVMSAVMISLTVVIAGAFSVMASGMSRMIETIHQSLSKMLDTMIETMLKVFNISGKSLSAAEGASLMRFLEFIQIALMAAQGGTQIGFAGLQKETAGLMKAYEIDQANIDQVSHILDLIAQDNQQYRAKSSDLLNTMSMIFLQQPNPQLS